MSFSSLSLQRAEKSWLNVQKKRRFWRPLARAISFPPFYLYFAVPDVQINMLRKDDWGLEELSHKSCSQSSAWLINWLYMTVLTLVLADFMVELIPILLLATSAKVSWFVHDIAAEAKDAMLSRFVHKRGRATSAAKDDLPWKEAIMSLGRRSFHHNHVYFWLSKFMEVVKGPIG